MLEERGKRKVRVGVIVSDKMVKTRVVQVETLALHRRYKKYIKRKKKYYAHDEKNETKVGDVVKIMETRPLSKMKRWRIIEIVRKAPEL